MDRPSPTFGSVYQSLSNQYKDRCPPGKSLDACELRANSYDAISLRVKTGEPSFFGRAKVRAAHQHNARVIVQNLNLYAGEDRSVNRETLNCVRRSCSDYIDGKNNRLTLGDLIVLQGKIDQSGPLPQLPTSASVSPDRDSKRGGASPEPARTSASPSRPAREIVATDFSQPGPASPERSDGASLQEGPFVVHERPRKAD
jgi:hypothetical protein